MHFVSLLTNGSHSVNLQYDTNNYFLEIAPFTYIQVEPACALGIRAPDCGGERCERSKNWYLLRGM